MHLQRDANQHLLAACTTTIEAWLLPAEEALIGLHAPLKALPSGTKYLHTAIDEVETHASIDLALSVADFFRLSPDAAHQQLAAVRTAVSGWSRVAASVGLDRAEISRMRPAFDHPGVEGAV